MRTRAAVAGWLFVMAGGAVVAQPAPLDRAELDRRTARVVHEAATQGSELYNRGGKAECYRLLQGTLLAVEPMLDHRPKLAVFVKEQLDKSAKMSPDAAAFELRKAIDAVLEQTASAFGPEKTPTPKDPPTPDKTAGSLWDRMGGEKVARATVKDFVAVATADAKLNLTRGGKYKLDAASTARLEGWLVDALSQVTGGPLKSTGKELGSFAAELNLTSGEVNGLALHFRSALERNKVGDTERGEFLMLVPQLRSKGVLK
ncbi:globin family protein [Urbifossiella limnaea]|uniref:Uncharacterized protein n=1 Tax=Urbifossiella limnaea TaxID=2528023 RepID=A0A517XVM9_9BACT|nr:hypothetical protein [Urbifossiella limnaea]QDU21563.1 hypothetical protein ETAA1_35330 [Urbifossiella limnaea]